MNHGEDISLDLSVEEYLNALCDVFVRNIQNATEDQIRMLKEIANEEKKSLLSEFGLADKQKDMQKDNEDEYEYDDNDYDEGEDEVDAENEGLRSNANEGNKGQKKKQGKAKNQAKGVIKGNDVMLSMTLDFFQGPHKGKTYKLQFGVAKSKKICYIGRSEEKKYVKDGVSLFKDDQVSENHGKFEISGKNKIYYTDMKSTNGTYINGVKIEPKKEYPITQGAVLRLGCSQCRVNSIN